MVNVAVVTPVYNTQDYLHRCVTSVLAQEGVTLNHIIVDDGSTDNSPNILRHYAETDSRVKLITKKNEGQGIARNVALNHVDAEYVYFVDSDDYLGEDTLRVLYESAKKHEFDICSPGVPGHYFDKPLEHTACLPCKSQFVRFDLIKEFDIRQPDVSSGQDGVFSHLVLAHSKRIGMNSKAQYLYTFAREGSTFASHLKRHDLIPSIVKGHYDAIKAHYDAHDLWPRNALRLSNFIADETLRNRIGPHYEHLSLAQRTEVISTIKPFAERAWSYLSSAEKELAPELISPLVNLSADKFGQILGEKLSTDAPAPSFPKNANFRKDGVTVCKYSDEKYSPVSAPESQKQLGQQSKPGPAPGGAKNVNPPVTNPQALKDIEAKLDFLVNTINNATIQLKAAIRLGESGLQNGMPGLVASVTTLRSRLPLVHLAIESIFAQTIKPSKVVLWLSDEIDPEEIETLELKALQIKGLDIRFVKDVGPHTKLMYALQEFGDQSIVTFDDDIMYPVNMIQALWAQHMAFPNAVIGNWARELAFDETGQVLGVRAGRLLTPPNLDKDIEQAERFVAQPTLKGFPYGTSGVLYPPGALNERVFEVDTFQALCPKEDDIWFRAMGILNQTPVVPTNLGINPKHHCITGSQYEALRHDNHGLQQNLDQMRRVFETLNLYEHL